MEYKNKDLIYLLSKDKYFKKILREAGEAKMYCDYPNDSKISFDCLFEMYNQDSILQQVELRSLYEREGSYSIALNHLVNEIQSICFYLDNTSKPFKDYKKEDIQVFLGDKVSMVSIIYIAKLFNRRNNNKASHSGTNNFLSQGVTKQEYFNYKGKMNIFLREISSYSFAASGRD